MNCGEFKIRNDLYLKNFSHKKYFTKLFYGETKYKNKENSDGEGIIIFDVGAHKGESAEFFYNIFPKAKIYSFEPNISNKESILEKKIPNLYLYHYALSDYDGSGQFYIQDLSHLSSLNKINKFSKSSLGYAKKEKHKIIKTEILRGDTFMNKKSIRKIDLLKLDVQSNEVDTIKGFRMNLNKINSIFVEISFYDFYQKNSTIKDLEAALPNFELYDIYEVSKNPKTLGTDWATFVYKNKIDIYDC